ncbi:hypothetical protein PHYPSEUDO_006752 [Phytophthora pseudosyringae]|uniref:Uncharacterized protein n=1 Tax=Phytophthora pseudosyringae TaxID=221518 RepID=A0A8T1VKT4_9STRA|nr:hypothetical protein PHYPSEUDO_006752 [Phytophthora pseudosyringae]
MSSVLLCCGSVQADATGTGRLGLAPTRGLLAIAAGAGAASAACKEGTTAGCGVGVDAGTEECRWNSVKNISKLNAVGLAMRPLRARHSGRRRQNRNGIPRHVASAGIAVKQGRRADSTVTWLGL